MKVDGSARILSTPEHILKANVVRLQCDSVRQRDWIHTMWYCTVVSHAYQERQKFIMLSSISCPGTTELMEFSSMMIDEAISFVPYTASF